ncbi:hypothetical protein SUGI_0702310 [Cryptomeria japonica]|uniref:inactive protein kinase SELMODRAFT_444075 n=1 Tax=Cryptomeria japonica TaxID=3369 RepID=UPI002414C3EC|nr:inactive protein kinase SELMODRAFT_444075 [Cryptomeria japonica]GLJ34885.1 hypothetical protein SUGI_0702310 [Cryptomeria japonica]
MNSAGTSASSSSDRTSNSPSEFHFELAIGYIEHVLSPFTNEGSPSKVLDSRMRLRDMMAPVASDFSKVCEGISQGAKMFADEKCHKSNLSSQVHTLVSGLLRGLGNAHWAAVGLLVIAHVIERLDKISTNDRECIDLLKGLLDLAKFIKMVKDINADFHTDILRKMNEAVHLIFSGAILCHSFISCKKISKFVLTKNTSEELCYLRGKVDRMKIDMLLQMNFMLMSSLTLHISRQQQHTDDGRLQHQPSNDIGISERTTPPKIEPVRSLSTGAENIPILNGENGPQPAKRLPRTILKFGAYLKYFTSELTTLVSHSFRECRKPMHTQSFKQLSLETSMVLNDDHLSIMATREEIGRKPIKFSLKDLREATNEFREILDQGGFGYTYRGTLTDGRQVVVKRSRDQSSTLVDELFVIANLRHPNILNLVGSCNTGSECLLVYDYMPNGNLSNLLFKSEQRIDWPTRRKIIEGVINALVYLHENEEHCIVHRDIKPTNILLDGQFNAKVSDFGIARMLPRRKYRAHEEGVFVKIGEVYGDTYHSTGAAGTLGYIAPECIRSGYVTKKADIYSFGLLLLNVVSGIRCLELVSIKDGMRSLIDRAWILHKEERLSKLIDPRLLNTKGFDSKSIFRTILVALWCIQIDPSKRPTASRALEMLTTDEKIPRPQQR